MLFPSRFLLIFLHMKYKFNIKIKVINMLNINVISLVRYIIKYIHFFFICPFLSYYLKLLLYTIILNSSYFVIRYYKYTCFPAEYVYSPVYGFHFQNKHSSQYKIGFFSPLKTLRI